MMMKWIKARQIRILTLCCILSIMLLNPLSAYASESDYVDVASEEGVVTDGYLRDGYYDDVIGVEKFVAPIEISNQKDKSTRASASADVSFYIHHIFYPSAL